MNLAYDRYLDQILGGWIGKSMGGAIGARFEENKGWIEISPGFNHEDWLVDLADAVPGA